MTDFELLMSTVITAARIAALAAAAGEAQSLPATTVCESHTGKIVCTTTIITDPEAVVPPQPPEEVVLDAYLYADRLKASVCPPGAWGFHYRSTAIASQQGGDMIRQEDGTCLSEALTHPPYQWFMTQGDVVPGYTYVSGTQNVYTNNTSH